MIKRLSRVSRNGQKTLSYVQEILPDVPELTGAPSNVWEGLGGPLGCPGVVGGTPECSGVVKRPSRMSGCGREDLLDIQE